MSWNTENTKADAAKPASTAFVFSRVFGCLRSENARDCLRRIATLVSMILLWLLAVGVVSLFFPRSTSGTSLEPQATHAEQGR